MRTLLASETELGRGATRSCDALSAMLDGDADADAVGAGDGTKKAGS